MFSSLSTRFLKIVIIVILFLFACSTIRENSGSRVFPVLKLTAVEATAFYFLWDSECLRVPSVFPLSPRLQQTLPAPLTNSLGSLTCPHSVDHHCPIPSVMARVPVEFFCLPFLSPFFPSSLWLSVPQRESLSALLLCLQSFWRALSESLLKTAVWWL